MQNEFVGGLARTSTIPKTCALMPYKNMAVLEANNFMCEITMLLYSMHFVQS